MTTTISEQPQKLSLGERLRRNPVVVKELRSRMRGRRAFIILTAYLLVLAAALGVLLFLFTATNTSITSINQRGIMGKAFFGVTVWLELMTVSFIAPALTAGAISTERERQTYELLRTTLLPAGHLVLGKFFSGLVFLLLLLLVAVPLLSLVFLFGGVATEEILVASLMLVVTTINLCAVGVFFSSFAKRTLVSTVLSYAYAAIMLFGVPMLVSISLVVVNSSSSLQNWFTNLSLAGQAAIIVIGLLLLSLNPITAASVSELIFVEENAIFTFPFMLPNETTEVTLISPWIPFSIFHLLLSVLLLALAVHFVRRPQR